MSELKIILLCGSRFAMPALQELAFFNQLAAVCIPCHCKDMIEDTEAVLMGQSIPILKMEKHSFDGQLKEAIEKYRINLGLVMTFNYKIPSSIYILPEKGFFNVHPSSLPMYRGADPIFQQIKNKEKYAGVTLHKLDDGIDTGPIVIKELIELKPGDTYGMLTTKLSVIAANLVRTLVKLAGFGLNITSKPQDETKASYFPKQTAKDIVINWNEMMADDVVALVNACNPWNKGAVTKIANKVIRFVQAVKWKGDDLPSVAEGTILFFQEAAAVVSTRNGEAIKLLVVSVDEGFYCAADLRLFGIVEGNRFETI